jgi:hypothetical protein
MSARKESCKRWYKKLKADPERWEQYLEAQRQRRHEHGQKKLTAERRARANELQRRARQNPARRERDRAHGRATWEKLPPGHPRKTRRLSRSKEAIKRARQKSNERLGHSVVANRYLFMKAADCPPELAALKREHIRLGRLLRNQTNKTPKKSTQQNTP